MGASLRQKDGRRKYHTIITFYISDFHIYQCIIRVKMRIQARKGKDEMTLKEFTKNNIKRLVLTALAAVIMFTSFAAVKPMTSPENHS